MSRDNPRTKKLLSLTGLSLCLTLAAVLMLFANGAHAQEIDGALTPGSIWDFFGTTYGDAYSSVFLNQIFGPLFPSASQADTTSVLAMIIGYFNAIVLLIGGLMFFYNVTIGVMQSAHEGQVLGQRWSSLWAPLRVVFAVGLLVPVNEGYNLAQTGIAYIVRGSTMMASAVWSSSATLILSGDTPVSTPAASFDPGTLANMYLNAACRFVMTQESSAVGGSVSNIASKDVPGTVTPIYDPHTRSTGPGPTGTAGVYMSYTNKSGMTSVLQTPTGIYDPGVCGSWDTPDVPAYIERVIAEAGNDREQEGSMTKAVAEDIKQTFLKGHEDLMKEIDSRMDVLVQASYPEVTTSGAPPSLKTADILAIHQYANSEVNRIALEVRGKATASGGVSNARDALLTRITGGDSCFSGSGDSSTSSEATDRATATSCYGEGWMGAGSWYITIAKISNELGSLLAASSSATPPSYTSTFFGLSDKQAFKIYGGKATGWGGLSISQDDLDDMELPSSEKIVEELIIYTDLFERSSIPLAAMGVNFSTDNVTAVNDDQVDSFWEKVLPEEMMLSATRLMIDYFDPAKSQADPMFGLIDLGHFLINMGSLILTASAVTGFFTGGGGAVALLPVYSLLLSSGVSLAFILPVMPFLYWIMGVAGYLLLIVEAIIAVNLWALSHMRMDGDGISGEAGRMGWLMILSLFMTPTLMIFGFLVGMILFRVSSDLVSAGMFYAVSGLLGANPVIWLFGTLGYVVITVTAHTLLLERSFSLVSEFPTRVMRWMGGEVNISEGNAMIRGAAALGAVGVNKMGNSMENAVGRVGQDGKYMEGVGIRGFMGKMGEKYRGNKGIGNTKPDGGKGSK